MAEAPWVSGPSPHVGAGLPTRSHTRSLPMPGDPGAGTGRAWGPESENFTPEPGLLNAVQVCQEGGRNTSHLTVGKPASDSRGPISLGTLGVLGSPGSERVTVFAGSGSSVLPRCSSHKAHWVTICACAGQQGSQVSIGQAWSDPPTLFYAAFPSAPARIIIKPPCIEPLLYARHCDKTLCIFSFIPPCDPPK